MNPGSAGILTVTVAAVALGGPRVLSYCAEHYFPDSVPSWLAPLLQGTSTSQRSALRFEEMLFDFGTILEGHILEREFRFVNHSDRPVTIQRARACACVTTTFPKDPIAPGADGIIHTSLDSRDRSGPQVKHIVLFTDEGEETEASVVLKGSIHSPLILPSRSVVFSNVQPGEALQEDLEIQASAGVSEVACEASEGFLKAELENQGANRYLLRLRGQAPRAAGAESATVHLRCRQDDGSEWSKEIPVRVVVPEAFQLLQDRVTLRAGKGILNVKTTWPDMARIENVESSSPSLIVEEKRRSENFLSLGIRLEGTSLPEDAKIILHTNSSTTPKLEVSVVQ